MRRYGGSNAQGPEGVFFFFKQKTAYEIRLSLVGSAIIWVPAAIYLFATGQLWQGAFIVGFFVIVIGLVDNILRPLLVGKDTRMPDYLILIATLGGMEIYGINGFVIGPLIAALFIACWNLLSGREHAGNTDEIDEEFIEEAKNSRNE